MHIVTDYANLHKTL